MKRSILLLVALSPMMGAASHAEEVETMLREMHELGQITCPELVSYTTNGVYDASVVANAIDVCAQEQNRHFGRHELKFDTHIPRWSYDGENRITRKIARLIEECAYTDLYETLRMVSYRREVEYYVSHTELRLHLRRVAKTAEDLHGRGTPAVALNDQEAKAALEFLKITGLVTLSDDRDRAIKIAHSASLKFGSKQFWTSDRVERDSKDLITAWSKRKEQPDCPPDVQPIEETTKDDSGRTLTSGEFDGGGFGTVVLRSNGRVAFGTYTGTWNKSQLGQIELWIGVDGTIQGTWGEQAGHGGVFEEVTVDEGLITGRWSAADGAGGAFRFVLR